MASDLWKLSYAGNTKSLAVWGIEGAQFHRRNLDTEELTFAIPTEDIFADPAFPYGATLTLYRGNTVWFTGRVTTTPAYASSGERQRYVVSNAWERFRRIIYQQQYILKTEDFTGVIGSWSTRVVLGKDAWGRKITASRQIENIAEYANLVGGSLITLADLGPYAIPPLETVRDISCVEAIRRMLAWTPDAVGFFSYSAGTTILTIRRRSDLTAVNLDLDDTDFVTEISGLTPRNDLVPAGVTIIYQTSERDETDEEVRSQPYTRETRDVAGSPSGIGVIYATVALGLQGTDQPEQPPSGLALQYFNSLSEVQWSGSLILKELECSGIVRPGHKVNLLNGRTAWASMNATVQETIEDLDTGKTQVTLGFAEHLGLSDFVDMMRRFRDRNEPGDFPGVQDNGTEGVDDQLDGVDPAGDSPIGPPGGAPDVEAGDRTPNTGSAGGGGGAGAASGDSVGGSSNSVTLNTCDSSGNQKSIVVRTM